MKFIDVNTKADLKKFYQFGEDLYTDNLFYRKSEEDILRMIIEGPTDFYLHAQVLPIIVMEKDITVCRFAFIIDKNMPDYVQIAFFEAQKVENLIENIENEAKKRFSSCSKICFGLNGHLNYGAGLLLNNFDKTPVFGLPYSMDYYKDYFSSYSIRKIKSFAFDLKISEKYKKLAARIKIDESINIRILDKKRLKSESAIYTNLNNLCFQEHPFWTDRTATEDLELFEPFKFLLQNEHLIFAYDNDKPIGFLLWFPDFNQLLNTNRELKANSLLSIDVLRNKYTNAIKTFRLVEIAVLPNYRKKGVEMLLINKMLEQAVAKKYKYGVGGFIFEENFDSINMAIKYIERVTGEKVKEDNNYAVFEKELW